MNQLKTRINRRSRYREPFERTRDFSPYREISRAGNVTLGRKKEERFRNEAFLEFIVTLSNVKDFLNESVIDKHQIRSEFLNYVV